MSSSSKVDRDVPGAEKENLWGRLASAVQYAFTRLDPDDPVRATAAFTRCLLLRLPGRMEAYARRAS